MACNTATTLTLGLGIKGDIRDSFLLMVWMEIPTRKYSDMISETNLQSTLKRSSHSESSFRLLNKSSVNYCEGCFGREGIYMPLLFRINLSALRDRVASMSKEYNNFLISHRNLKRELGRLEFM